MGDMSNTEPPIETAEQSAASWAESSANFQTLYNQAHDEAKRQALRAMRAEDVLRKARSQVTRYDPGSSAMLRILDSLYFTSHGHHVEGVTPEGAMTPDVRARCGGPDICLVCQRDAETLTDLYGTRA